MVLYHGMFILSPNFYINASKGVSADQRSLPAVQSESQQEKKVIVAVQGLLELYI